MHLLTRLDDLDERVRWIALSALRISRRPARYRSHKANDQRAGVDTATKRQLLEALLAIKEREPACSAVIAFVTFLCAMVSL